MEIPTQPRDFDRYLGGMFGLAVGDALGTTLEFKPPGSFEPITDMIGGGPFRLNPGEWTDDTSMAMCLAESLVIRNGFDARDQIDRYRQWWRAGYWSCKDHCFDIGGTVSKALRRFEEGGEPYAGSLNHFASGNGSLMRLVPVPLFFARNPAEAIALSRDSSRTTHGSQACLDACGYYAGLILGALYDVPKEVLLSPRYRPFAEPYREGELHPEVEAVASGSFKEKEPPAIRGTGYVVDSLEAALWAFHRADNFRDGALLAVNLGDDADTTGAVYGQLAGTFHGYEGIPETWREKIAWHKQIRRLTEKVYRGAMARGR